MEYKVLVGTSPDLLTVIVNIHITFDWRPVGGVSVAVDNCGIKTFSQAVIKGD